MPPSPKQRRSVKRLVDGNTAPYYRRRLRKGTVSARSAASGGAFRSTPVAEENPERVARADLGGQIETIVRHECLLELHEAARAVEAGEGRFDESVQIGP